MKEIVCPTCKGMGKIIVSDIEVAIEKEREIWHYPLTSEKEIPTIYTTWDGNWKDYCK